MTCFAKKNLEETQTQFKCFEFLGVAMPDATDYVWDQYEESIKMSTYLLAFVISDFKYRVGIKTENQVQFRIWSRSEALEQTEYAADIGPKILQYYEDYFKVPFPLPKQVCRIL